MARPETRSDDSHGVFLGKPNIVPDGDEKLYYYLCPSSPQLSLFPASMGKKSQHFCIVYESISVWPGDSFMRDILLLKWMI